MKTTVREAYELAEKACSDFTGSAQDPEYSIEMPIALAKNGMVDADEYVNYIQSVAACIACLDIASWRFAVDDVFYIDFFPTHQMAMKRFRIVFPIVDADAFGGDKYAFGDKTFSSFYRLILFGPKRDYSNFSKGDFSAFTRLDD